MFDPAGDPLAPLSTGQFLGIFIPFIIIAVACGTRISYPFERICWKKAATLQKLVGHDSLTWVI